MPDTSPAAPAPVFRPVSAFDVPRYAGPASFMRLPLVDIDAAAAAAVEIGILGVPWDGGTTNRPGARRGSNPQPRAS